MEVDKVPIPRSNREIAANAKKEKRYTTRKKFFFGRGKNKGSLAVRPPQPKKKKELHGQLRSCSFSSVSCLC